MHNINIHSVNPAVVIPVYQDSLGMYEKISIARTFDVLSEYPIVLLSPQSKQHSIQRMLAAILPNAKYTFHLVEDHWLDSVASYNHLMLKRSFYDFYHDYTHILVAQLDSYVFRNELEKWCLRPWAYIGAPIYPAGACYGEMHCQSIGCGGFSLRNISSFLRAFDLNPRIVNQKVIRSLLSPYNLKGKFVKLTQSAKLMICRDLKVDQKHNSIQRLVGINEDVVFGRYLPQVLSDFLVPGYREACLFSLDRYVEIDLQKLSQLPFGIHAWFSRPSTLRFWSNYITELQCID